MYPNPRRRPPTSTPFLRVQIFLNASLPWPRLRLRIFATSQYPHEILDNLGAADRTRLLERRSRYYRRDSRGPWVRTRRQIPPTR